MNVIKVFVAFTKAQLIHIQNILISESFENVILISRFEVNNELSSLLMKLFIINGNVLQVRKRWLLVKKYIISHECVEFHIAHCFNIFTQDLLHLLIKKNKLSQLNIFPDGNLLYNNYTVGFFDREQLVKKISSYLISTEYKMFKGSIISPFATIDTVYSYLPEVTCESKNIEIIQIPRIEQPNLQLDSALMILGHRNQKVIDEKLLVEVVKRNDFSNAIYYKPHPRLKLSEDLFFKELKSCFRHNLHLIENNDPIESLITQYPINRVFAVASSSLVTLKMLLPQIDICYFGIEEYLGKHYNPLVKQQFFKLDLIEWT